MKISQKGQGLGEFIILLLLVVIVILAIGIIQDKAKIRAFDQKFASGEITIVGRPLGLGEVGNPLETAEISGIPYGDITGIPRVRHVTGCETIYLPSQFKTVFVAAPIIADQITVQVPIQAGKYVNVCVPDLLVKVPVYIWAE